MKLSKRLATISALIEKYSINCILGDIGSDHGYLPCYLALNDIVSYAYACDVAKLPLESAKKSISLYGVSNKVESLLGNGIEPLIGTNVDTISISGMGSFLIVDILKANLDVAKNMKMLYLQANANIDHLREFLYGEGFDIIDEVILYEGHHYYEILVVQFTDKVLKKNIKDIIFGPILRIEKNDYFINKWSKQLEVFNKLVNSMDNNHKKYNEIKNKTIMIEEVLNEGK